MFFIYKSPHFEKTQWDQKISKILKKNSLNQITDF